MRGIHRWPVNSPHKWPVTRKMFPFDDVIMGRNDKSALVCVVPWHRAGYKLLPEGMLAQIMDAYMSHRASTCVAWSSAISYVSCYGLMWSSLWVIMTGHYVDIKVRVRSCYRTTAVYPVLISWSALTHLPPEEMAAISQTICSKAFLWMKMYEYRLKFHWSLFPDNGLAPTRRQAIIWTNVDPVHRRIYAALGGGGWVKVFWADPHLISLLWE